MIYVVYKATRNRWAQDSVHEFENEAMAIQFCRERPRAGIIGIFKGQRLEPKVGETKVVKKTVTGFELLKEDSKENK